MSFDTVCTMAALFRDGEMATTSGSEPQPLVSPDSADEPRDWAGPTGAHGVEPATESSPNNSATSAGVW